MLAWMSQVVSGWLANRYRLFSLQPLLLFIPFIPLYPSFFIPSPAAGVIGLHIESKFPNFSNTPSSFRQNEGRKTKYKSGSELLSFSLNSQWTNCEKKKCWGKGTTHTHYGTVFMQSTFSFIRFSTSSLEYPKQAVYTFTVSVSREDFAQILAIKQTAQTFMLSSVSMRSLSHVTPLVRALKKATVLHISAVQFSILDTQLTFYFFEILWHGCLSIIYQNRNCDLIFLSV